MSGEDTGDEPPKIDTALWSRYSGMLLLCKGKRKYLVGRSPVPVLLRAFLAGQGPGRPLACLLRANRTPCSWGPALGEGSIFPWWRLRAASVRPSANGLGCLFSPFGKVLLRSSRGRQKTGLEAWEAL